MTTVVSLVDPPSEMSAPLVKPSGLQVDFDKDVTRLYQAITNSDWKDAIAAVNAKPEEAKTWVVRHYDDEEAEGQEQEIMWRFLPIHSACARQPSGEVIKALIQAYPDGAKCVDDQGMYALHYACGNQASREVIRMLLMSFPDAAKLKDPRGMLPIHYLSCWGPSSISVIDMVLVANRDVAHTTDEDGNTPLDLAMEGEYPERDAVIAALKRWLENTAKSPSSANTSNAVATKGAPTSASRSAMSGTSSNPIVTSPVSDEKKEQEADVVARSLGEMASQDTVNRLRQEIVELKKSQETLTNNYEARMKALEITYETRMDTAEASYQDRIKSQESEIDTLKDRVKELEAQAQQDKNRIAEIETEALGKSQQLDKSFEVVSLKEDELRNAHEERDGLRQTLADLTEQHDRFKIRSEVLSDRLGSLNASLYSMMEQQNIVLDAMKAREEQWATLQEVRRQKMRELLELEEQEQSDEVDMKVCLLKQTKEMEAIQAVIAAVRTTG